jgi:triacylglycerol lipase
MPGKNFYRGVKTRHLAKSRNREQIVSNLPPLVVPVLPPQSLLNIDHFEALDGNKDGLLSVHEFLSAAQPTSNFDFIRAAELMRLSIYANEYYNSFMLNTLWQIPAPFDKIYTIKNRTNAIMYASYEQVKPTDPLIPIGFIAESIATNDVYVVWRGTKNGIEWKQDAKFFHTPCSFLPQRANKTINVELGFHELYVTGGTHTPSPQNSVKNYLNNLTNKINRTVWVTGHSLGGALSTMNACDLLENVKGFKSIRLYNFASPRVGDENFADIFDSLTLINGKPGAFRTVNERDIVPKLPLEIFGYKHVNEYHKSISFGTPLNPIDIFDKALLSRNHSNVSYFEKLVEAMKNNGISATVLKNNHFTATELLNGTYTSSQLLSAGYTASEVQQAVNSTPNDTFV